MPEVLTPKLTLKELVRRLETLQAQCAELVKLRRRPALQLVAETAQPAQIGRARTRRTLSGPRFRIAAWREQPVERRSKPSPCFQVAPPSSAEELCRLLVSVQVEPRLDRLSRQPCLFSAVIAAPPRCKAHLRRVGVCRHASPLWCPRASTDRASPARPYSAVVRPCVRDRRAPRDPCYMCARARLTSSVHPRSHRKRLTVPVLKPLNR